MIISYFMFLVSQGEETRDRRYHFHVNDVIYLCGSCVQYVVIMMRNDSLQAALGIAANICC